MDKKLEIILEGLKKCFRGGEERTRGQMIQDIINFDGCSERTAKRVLELVDAYFETRRGEKRLKYYKLKE